MRLRFAKMQGLGNDFVVFDAVNQEVRLAPEQLRRIADRRLGVGCDQVLVVRPASDTGVDFDYQIYNGNGMEVGQCGNGARCVGKFLGHNGLTSKKSVDIKTISGVYHIDLRDDGLVTVDMGRPVFAPQEIPFLVAGVAPSYRLEIEAQQFEIGVVSMGNPHAIIQVDDIDDAPVAILGPKIETHAAFPDKTNVGFMQVLDTGNVALRVFERDVGETHACGSGACAAAVIGRVQRRLDSQVTVRLPGGSLEIEYQGANESVLMTGPAQLSFEGELTL